MKLFEEETGLSVIGIDMLHTEVMRTKLRSHTLDLTLRTELR